MSAARSGSSARGIAGFVWQSMAARGIRCERPQLEAAFAELSPAQQRAVHGASQALARGSDAREVHGLLRGLRLSCSAATRQALEGIGAECRADVLLTLASAEPSAGTLARAVALLQRPGVPAAEREQAAQELLALCGARAAPAEAELPPVPPASALLPTVAAATRPQRPEPEDEVRPPLPVAAAPAASTRAPAAQPSCQPPATPSAERARRRAKVFGKQGALTWETAPLRQAQGEGPAPTTVMVEGARAQGDGFDWNAKVIFMCTLRELPRLLAVLMGWTDGADFEFHGREHQKSLSLQHQDHGLYVRLRDGRRQVHVPVEDADRYALAMLVLSALVANEPDLDAQAVLAVCRAVAVRPAYLGR